MQKIKSLLSDRNFAPISFLGQNSWSSIFQLLIDEDKAEEDLVLYFSRATPPSGSHIFVLLGPFSTQFKKTAEQHFQVAKVHGGKIWVFALYDSLQLPQMKKEALLDWGTNLEHFELIDLGKPDASKVPTLFEQLRRGGL